MKRAEGEKGKRRREAGKGECIKREYRGSSSFAAACVSCVIFFFLARSSLTLSLSRDSEVGSRDSHRDKGWKTGNCFSLLPPHRRHKQEEKTSTTTTTTKKVQIVFICLRGRGALISPAFCMCSAHYTLCFQMERTQGDGEVDHLERPSPLTDKERVMIQASWGKVYQNCDDVGVAILVRYFLFYVCLRKYLIHTEIIKRVLWKMLSIINRNVIFELF